jgi:hypothetical protein
VTSRLRTRAAVGVIAALVLACGGSGGPTGPTDRTDPGSGPWAFRASLIDPALILAITPLGSLNPPARPLPTDHIYIEFARTNESPAARRTAFFAPADGIVRNVLTSTTSPDIGLHVRVTSQITYILGHIIPDIPLASGMKITAGQRLGTTGSSFSIDLGVTNAGTPSLFVNPARYPNVGLVEAPLKYFDEPLRSQLYAKVERVGAELDGTIYYDIPGRLSGNWFTADAIPLVFAYHWYDPARVVISVSGGLLRNGVYGIAATDPLPRDVSVASGMVRYTLSGAYAPIVTGTPTARMLVQMLDDQRVRVEMFELSASASAFTGNAMVFTR